MKLVVTGAAGFIGSHLTDRLLAAGHDVLGIDAFVDYYPRAVKEDNLRQARDHRSFRLVEGLLQEIDLAELIDGAGVIYHLAAQAGVRASWGREFELYTTHNVLGTQRLLESAKAAGTPRVVCASSSSVYGESPSLPLREDAPCRPLSPYGVTKLASENLQQKWKSRLPGIARSCTDAERRADEAEREIVKIKLLRFLQDHVDTRGKVLEAVITGVQEYGLFAQLVSYSVEGLIKVADMRDGHYVFDPRRRALKGRNTGRTFTLGQSVRVAIEKIDTTRRQMDLVLRE